MSNIRGALSQLLVVYKWVTAVMLIRNKDNKTVITFNKNSDRKAKLRIYKNPPGTKCERC